MFRITNFQLYCILVILVIPVAYLELASRLIAVLYNNAWLAVIAALIPGILLILMYSYIIKKSRYPFPLLLDEHLGKFLGRLLGFAYIPIFILSCSYNLRVFIEFMKMNVLPATPISIFIGVLLFIGFIAIKTGLENIARISELIVFVGFPFSFIIVIIALVNNPHFDRMLPISYVNYKSLGLGIMNIIVILGKMMPVLTLAFFSKPGNMLKLS